MADTWGRVEVVKRETPAQWPLFFFVLLLSDVPKPAATFMAPVPLLHHRDQIVLDLLVAKQVVDHPQILSVPPLGSDSGSALLVDAAAKLFEHGARMRLAH
jgi:hypothetical protein